MKSSMLVIALGALWAVATAKPLDNMQKAGQAYTLISKYLEEINVRSTDPAKREMSELEIAMCGEYGLGGAFWEAYQLEPEPNSCPPPEDSVWGLVAAHPFILCFMEAQDRINGISCVEDVYYDESNPAEPFQHLHRIIEFVTAIIAPYL